MKGPAVSEAERAEIFRLARAKTSYRAIAEQVQRPYGTVANMLSQAITRGELVRRRRKKAMTTSERDRILCMARQGELYRVIAARLQRPYGTIANLLSQAIVDGLVPPRRERENRRQRQHYVD